MRRGVRIIQDDAVSIGWELGELFERAVVVKDDIAPADNAPFAFLVVGDVARMVERNAAAVGASGRP